MTHRRPRKAHDRSPTLFFHKARARWYIIAYPNRKRTWIGTGTADAAVAKDKLAEYVKLLGAADLGLVELPTTEQAHVTIGQCLDLLTADYHREERGGIASTASQIKPVRQLFGGQRVSALALGHVHAVREVWRRQGFAKATINRRISNLRRALVLAHAEGLLAKLPAFKWPRYDERDNVREGFIDPETLARVNAAEPEPAIRSFNEWGYWTGMRFRSICQMTWGGFDLRTWSLRIHPRTTKNQEGLVFKLPAGPIRAIIAARWADRRPTCPYVFHIEGQPIRYGTRWTAAWTRAGLPLKTTKHGHRRPVGLFHDLRRTGVRNLVLAGVPEKTVMLISGHKSRVVFDRYNITTEREVEAALATVGAHIGPLPTLPPVAPSSHALAWRARRARQPAVPVRPLVRRTRPAPATTPATSAHGGA